MQVDGRADNGKVHVSVGIGILHPVINRNRFPNPFIIPRIAGEWVNYPRQGYIFVQIPAKE
jgi:hypothetical protein